MDELAGNLQENQEMANFCDLPMELLEKIASEADLSGRLVLRKVSKTLRIIIDKLGPPKIYNQIGIRVNSEFMKLDLNGHLIFYRKTKGKETIVGDSRRSKKIQKNLFDTVVDDLNSFISHPKVQIKHFKIIFTDEKSYRIFSKRFRKCLPPGRLFVQFVLIKGHQKTILSDLMDWFDYNKMAQLEFVCLVIERLEIMLRCQTYIEFRRTKMRDDRGFPIFNFIFVVEETSTRTLEPHRVYGVHSTIRPDFEIEKQEIEKRRRAEERQQQKQRRKLRQVRPTVQKTRKPPQPKPPQPKWNPYFSKHKSLK